MPNIKSAKKRVIVNAKKTEQNKFIRTAVKTDIKRIETLIKENKIEEAKIALPEVFKSIDEACSKNIFHKNNASRKKAKLAKKLDAVSKNAPATPVKEVKAEVKTTENVEKVEPVEEVKAPAKKPATKKTTTTTTKKTTTAKKPATKKEDKAE